MEKELGNWIDRCTDGQEAGARHWTGSERSWSKVTTRPGDRPGTDVVQQSSESGKGGEGNKRQKKDGTWEHEVSESGGG